MSKLGVSKLVQAASGCHTEVAPDILATPEIQFLHCAGAGLETLKGKKGEWSKMNEKSERRN